MKYRAVSVFLLSILLVVFAQCSSQPSDLFCETEWYERVQAVDISFLYASNRQPEPGETIRPLRAGEYLRML
jgi:hypothetical protein